MPGYTCTIKDGISFKDFVMRCSRAISVLSPMGDKPLGAVIPERFESSGYYPKRIKELQEEINNLDRMDHAQVQATIDKLYEDKIKNCEESQRKGQESLVKYKEMLAKAEAWVPPTANHLGLKDFMIAQIKTSLGQDISLDDIMWKIGDKPTIEQWIKERKDELENELTYLEKKLKIDVERTEERNTWLRQLRESLN